MNWGDFLTWFLDEDVSSKVFEIRLDMGTNILNLEEAKIVGSIEIPNDILVIVETERSKYFHQLSKMTFKEIKLEEEEEDNVND